VRAVKEESRYNSSDSYIQHLMVVSGRIRASAALALGQGLPASISAIFKREIISCPCEESSCDSSTAQPSATTFSFDGGT